MGDQEPGANQNRKQFTATVFFGSGLLFLAMMFASAAIAGSFLVPGCKSGLINQA